MKNLLAVWIRGCGRMTRGAMLALGVLVAVVTATAAFAAPALAAPRWGVSVSSENAFGEASFEKGSADDHYTITITNEGNEPAGAQSLGSTLECEGKTSASRLEYRWLRDGAVIVGATSKRYHEASRGEDEGDAIQCEVIAQGAEGTTVTVSPRVLIGKVPSLLPPSGGNVKIVEPPTIVGTANVGETLTCEAEAEAAYYGTWKPAPEHYEYHWLRGGSVITGASSGPITATSFTYQLGAADAGQAIQCEVVATDAGGSQVAVTAPMAVLAAPPQATAVPALSPTSGLSSGVKLTCTNGSWTGSPTEYEYQWLRNGVPIRGAKLAGTTASSFEYTLGNEDEGTAVQCQVAATSAEGTTTAVSVAAGVGTFSQAPPSLIEAPEASLYPDTAGGKANCYWPGTWEGEPTSYEYQWLRSGVPIAGATSSTYTPVAADVGQPLQCEVTAANAGGSSAAYTAAAVVAAILPTATAAIPASAITLTDTLPAGVEVGTRAGVVTKSTSAAAWSCAITGVDAARCDTPNDVIEPGESRTFTLYVRVNQEAVAGSPDDLAAVSGGGASPSEASAEHATTIVDRGFGFESVWASVVDEFGQPFSQSTGHPFSATAHFVFNNTTSENGELVTLGGDAKNIEVLLPPGFVGSPELYPTCEVGQFEGGTGSSSGCPADTAVGYVYVPIAGFNEAKLEDGHRPSNYFAHAPGGVVYNLKPPVGSPAAFGFKILTQNFYLTASVRSDSDYGITITSARTPPKPELLGAEFTFCDSGVKFVQVSLGISNAACKAASPGSKPFLQNPAQCTGAPPHTTIRMNTWEHPGQEITRTVYTGRNLVEGAPNAIESFVNGCASLMFDPTIEPVPLSTQADHPTGVSVLLKVPQHTEVQDEVGSVLACLPGGWTGSPSNFSYQWLIDGSEVSGATGQTYTVTAADVGKSVQCLVVAGNGSNGAATVGTLSEVLEEATTPTTVPPAPSEALPAPPVAGIAVPSGGFFGTATAGSTLTCNPGTWEGSPTFAYQWLRNGVPISGATGETYKVQTSDATPASLLQCEVLAANGAGTIAAVSTGIKTAFVMSPAAPALSTAAGVSVQTPPDTPEVKDTTVTFPPGMSLSPSAADGLEGCTDAQFAIHSLGAGTCPDGSQIGTVKIVTPLLTFPLEGELFLGEPECGQVSPCTAEDAEDGKMFRLFMQAVDPENGVDVKVEGTTSVNPTTGQVTASFDETPQLPFEVLELKLKNGPRAPFAMPQECGAATTRSEFVPWSTGGSGGVSGSEAIEGTQNATSETSFDVTWNGQGEACPSSLPFSPAFNAGTSSTSAAANGGNALSVNLSREDREQDLGAITLHTPAGLLGYVSKVSLCEEPQAAAGSCSAASRIGSVTAGAGPGTHPYFVTGSVYLTGPYKGAPFGLSIVVPTKAGPFNLGDVVVRASVSVDPHTAELTVVSDPLPQILDGIPLRLRDVHVEVDREGFIVNPTGCEAKQITATITGAPPRGDQSEAVKSSSAASSFDVGGCAEVPFKPGFTASTSGKTSRAKGASLHVAISYPGAGEANIHSVHVELPKALPSRLSTLQKACPEAVFDANPSSCPAASVVGTAIAHTPVLSVPLEGPAYFVSHGGAKFPELILVLQGQGVTIMLEGETFISKAGVTSSTFKTVPDAPVSSFELTLPEGKDSALAAPGNKLCSEIKKLVMPTTIAAQSGKQITQKTKIKVTGCAATKKHHKKHNKPAKKHKGHARGKGRRGHAARGARAHPLSSR